MALEFDGHRLVPGIADAAPFRIWQIPIAGLNFKDFALSSTPNMVI